MSHINFYFLPLSSDGVEGANVGGAEEEDEEGDEEEEEEKEEESWGGGCTAPIDSIMDCSVAKFLGFLIFFILFSTPL